MKKCLHLTHCHEIDELIASIKRNEGTLSDVFAKAYNEALEYRRKYHENCECECCLEKKISK
jgi:hypothetical protein